MKIKKTIRKIVILCNILYLLAFCYSIFPPLFPYIPQEKYTVSLFKLITKYIKYIYRAITETRTHTYFMLLKYLLSAPKKNCKRTSRRRENNIMNWYGIKIKLVAPVYHLPTPKKKIHRNNVYK